MTRPLRWLSALSSGLAWLEGAGIAACLLVLLLLPVWQFADRNAGALRPLLPPAPPWSDQVVRHTVFLLGFLSGAYAAHHDRHIRIDALCRLLPPRGRQALTVLTTLAAVVVVGLLGRAAWAFFFINPSDDPLVVLGAAVGYGMVSLHLLAVAARSWERLVCGGPS
jgi:TRAP-type C4-dicarboxylate transport system permease small subunit